MFSARLPRPSGSPKAANLWIRSRSTCRVTICSWGARHIDGRGFDPDHHRQANFNPPMKTHVSSIWKFPKMLPQRGFGRDSVVAEVEVPE